MIKMKERDKVKNELIVFLFIMLTHACMAYVRDNAFFSILCSSSFTFFGRKQKKKIKTMITAVGPGGQRRRKELTGINRMRACLIYQEK